MILYRWFYDESEKHSISGVVLADNWDEAVEETKKYLIDQFSDINGIMNFVISDEAINDTPTLWVWEFFNDDDFHVAHENCIAVSY